MLKYASLYYFMRVYAKIMTTENQEKTIENQHFLLKPLYINGLKIDNRLILAPMAGCWSNILK